MKVRVKAQNASDEEEDMPRVATSTKKGKRSRQIVEDGSSGSDNAPPSKRRSSSAAPPKSKASKKSSVDFTDSESDANEEAEVDVEGSSDAAPPDDDAADTASSHSSSPAKPRPSRRQAVSSKAKPNRVQSDEDEGQTSENEDAAPPPRQSKALPAIPRRQPTQSSSSTPTATKPLRKPVTSKQSKDKDTERGPGAAISNIPSIPRRPKDASAVVKDTQDMDLLNKDVYNQLFNTSAGSKPAAKHVQNEAKQKEIDAKRAAAKAALLEARTSSFDLQLPTDKVLAFENRLRKLHRWYAPSALGFTYHEELRLRQRPPQRPADGNSDINQSTVAK